MTLGEFFREPPTWEEVVESLRVGKPFDIPKEYAYTISIAKETKSELIYRIDKSWQDDHILVRVRNSYIEEVERVAYNQLAPPPGGGVGLAVLVGPGNS